MLIFAVPWVGGCNGDRAATDTTESRPLAVRVTEVRPAVLVETIDYVGTVSASEQVRVSARAAGTVASLEVDRGDALEAGDVVARIRTPELRARLSGANAEFRRAESERDYACERYETDRDLSRDGALTNAQLDVSRKRCRSGKEAVSAAEAKRRELRSRLRDSVIRAPTDGHVLRRLVSEGENVGPGRPILVIGSEELEVTVRVVESDLARGIEVGTPVEMQIARGPVLRSTVTEVAPIGGGPARTFEVTVAVEEKGDARPGMSADVGFVIAEDTSATPVPRTAIGSDEEGEFVFSVHEGVARRRYVSAGLRVDGMVAVEPSLPAGTRVAITNVGSLTDGDRVYAVEARGGRR